MGVALNKSNSNLVKFADLRDRDIVEDIEYREDSYRGSIAQRFGNSLITLGVDSGISWDNDSRTSPTFRVLQPGEAIIITE